MPLQGEFLLLHPDGPVETDLAAFAEAATAARRDGLPAPYVAALAHYGGDLLPEDRYEEWTQGPREESRGIYLALLAELARLYERRGSNAEAIATLERLVAAEPTDEAAHVGLMRLHALSGQRQLAIRQYQQLRGILRRELDVAPEPATRRLHDDIAAERFPEAGSRKLEAGSTSARAERRSGPQHNLPVPLTSFVGRERERTEICAILTSGDTSLPTSDFRLPTSPRLITLTGAGGCGKTRLALAVAHTLTDEYPDGVWLVDLSALSDPRLVSVAVAQVLTVREEVGRPLLATLLAALQPQRLLLVLDNCEHLLSACADFVRAVAEECPGIAFLTTSRQPLGLPGEVAWRVPSLALPDPRHLPRDGAALVPIVRASEAAQLFAARAAARQADFIVTAATAPAIIAICQRLDGIPLAIELAAAWVPQLQVTEIAERLGNALPMLTGGSRLATSRQRTLRGALDWSYRLLSPAEQRQLRQLSLFVGGFTLAAAEAVDGGAVDSRQATDTLDLLTALVTKSLVQVEQQAEGTRYRLLETVRQYAAERIADASAAGELAAAQRHHAGYYVELVEEADPQLLGDQRAVWLGVLERDYGNVRAALAWAVTAPDATIALRFGISLAYFWYWRSDLTEGRHWLEAILRLPGTDDPKQRANVLNSAAVLAYNQLDFERAQALHHERLPIVRALGDKRAIAFGLHNLGTVVREGFADYAQAYEYGTESVALLRELDLKVALITALDGLGITERELHNPTRARALHEEAAALARELKQPLLLGAAVANIGQIELDAGDLGTARARYREAVALWRDVRATLHLSTTFAPLAVIATRFGECAHAARLGGAAEAATEKGSMAMVPVVRARLTPALASARAALGDDAFNTQWEAGRALSLDEMYAEALGEAPAAGKK
ncbi:MAG: BTAD domain-containing putative transcriptional regulator [Chloroflexia bacterium]